GFEIKDFLATPQAQVLIPQVIIGTMKKAADPNYLASKFFKKIRMTTGQAVIFPTIGVMRAYDVAEGQEIPQETIDWQQHKTSLIKVGKAGLRVQVTEELMKDADWDIVSMLLQEAGRAMSRHTEQKAFVEWLAHGWTVFDNTLRATYPDAGTTGLDFEGNYNDTMSLDDFLDIIIAVYNNEYTPTDTVMHPLVWSVFARNGFTGGFNQPMDREANRESAQGSFKLGPSSVQGRMPFALNVNLSPFAPIDRRNKLYNMFVVDRNNVGVHIIKDDLKTEQFRDPARDIHNVKLIKREGFGVFNEGRAICVARNISMAKSWPQAERVYNIN
ncbi:MAG: phage major capsid protein, partial [Sphaerochaetaceae bacterium]